MNRILNKAIGYGAEITMTAKGVTTHVNVQGEEAWIETSADFDVADIEVLREAEMLLECFGYSIITEEPPTMYEDGRMRHWAEQRFFPSEIGLQVAM